MPALSWNEIRQRAFRFSREWEGAKDERAEAQTFWNEFFEVFGFRRRTVASFEEPVKSIKSTYHRIDLFWKGRLLAEHKSAGANLAKAGSQAFQYIQELAASDRQHEIPRYVIISDFTRMVLYDLEPEEGDPDRTEFLLSDLNAHIKDFAFFVGQKVHKLHEEDEANLKAARLLTWRAVWMLDGGVRNSLEASMAKAKAGLAVTQITQKCVELLGPMGYSRKLLLEKWMRDAKINDIFEGTGQIQMLITARNVLGFGRDKLK